MSFGGGGGGTTVNRLYDDHTTTNQLPDWVEQAGQENYGKAQQIASTPYQSYGGERVADLTPDTQNAFSMTREVAAQPNQGMDAARALFMGGATAGPNTIGTSQMPFQPSVGGGMQRGGPEGLPPNMMGHNGGPSMDGPPSQGQPGQLGPVGQTGPNTGGSGLNDHLARMFQGAAGGYNAERRGGVAGIGAYMNPFLQQMLAPQLRGIAQKGAETRNRIGQNMTMGGAFGDARHGIADANQAMDESTQTQDAIGTMFGQAFNNAQGLQQQDLSRQQSADQFNTTMRDSANKFNAGQQDSFLQRLFQGGNALSGLDQSSTQLGLTKANALNTIGQQQQANQQQKNDVGYQTFQEQRDYPLRNLQILQSALKNTPYETSQRTEGWKDQATSTGGGGGGGGGGIGSALGAIGGLFSI